MRETFRSHSLGIAVFWLHSDVLCWSCAVEHSVTFIAPLGFLPSIPGGCQVEIRGFQSTHLKWSWQSPALLVWVKTPQSLWGNAVWWVCRFGGFISPSCSLRDHFLTTSFFLELETYLTELCVWVNWDSIGFPLPRSQIDGCSVHWFSQVAIAELFLPALLFLECYWSPSWNIFLQDRSSHSYALFSSIGVSDHLLAGESCKQLCILQWNHTESEGVRRTVGSDAKGNLAFPPHPLTVEQNGKATCFLRLLQFWG